MKRIIHVLLVCLCTTLSAQLYNPISVFSHNDYAGSNPFYGAYALRVGYIEADVFLADDRLFVAHFQSEIKQDRTLEALYLEPLKKEIIKNSEWAYPDTTLPLKLMIDLKTEGMATLKKLISQLYFYPEVVHAKGFEIFISGNAPSPDRWSEFPSFIYFDGRPGIKYAPEQLERISLISDNFRNYSKWTGLGDIPPADKTRLDSLINSVHAIGKKIRFWSAPDNETGWSALVRLKADVIGTDRVPELVQYLKEK